MSKVAKSSFLLQNTARRLLATQAATAESASPLAYQATKLVNGTSVVTIENSAPVSRVAIAAKAGSRYETSENRGASHVLRVMTGMRTDDTTAVTMTRHLQQLGAKLRCTTNRDVVVYTLECLRDLMPEGLAYVKEVALLPLFRSWELRNNSFRLAQDRAVLKTKPDAMLVECLHEAAYRSGYSNSLYCPEHMIGQHTSEMMSQYVKEHFTTGRLSVGGVGVNHDDMMAFANALPAESGAGSSTPAAYRGGEIHRDTGGPSAHVAVCVESPGLKSAKDIYALLLLEQILGTGPHTKYGLGLGSRLGAAAAKASPDTRHFVGAVNMLYQDSGLFGFAVSAPYDKAAALTKALADEMKIIMGGKLSDADVAIGKARLKAEAMCSDENQLQLLEDLTTYPLLMSDMVSLPQFMAEIDKLTLNDVTGVARKVLGGKPTMAAVGNVSSVPYLDQL